MNKYLLFFKQIDRKLLIKLVVFFLFYVALIGFGLIPAFYQMKSISKDRTARIDERARTITSAQGISELAQKQLQYKARLEDFLSYLPSEKEVEGLMGEISEMATAVGVKILEMNPIDADIQLDGDLSNYFEFYAFELQMETKFHDFGAFIQKMENYNKLIRIVRVEMEPDIENIDVQDVQIELLIFSKSRKIDNLLSIFAF